MAISLITFGKVSKDLTERIVLKMKQEGKT